MTKLTTIRNIGAKMAQYLELAGITDVETLNKLGVEEAMVRVLEKGHGNHIFYYQALRLGLMGRAWNDVAREEKEMFKAEFAAIQRKASARFQGHNQNELPPLLAKQLAEIGVK